ncbi:MAG: hypothetical protein J6C92_14770 [Bacteroidaceae bacterium]|nr:hypothetical protein [Bacteroidaceae bacterium]
MKLYIKSSQDTISPLDLEPTMSKYAGRWETPSTGWVGLVKFIPDDVKDDGNNICHLSFIGDNGSVSETLTVWYDPTRGKRPVVVYPEHGMPTNCGTVQELDAALRKEFSGMRRVK